MRTLLAVLMLLVLGLASSARAEPPAIPEFTPNVVDPGHVLDAAATEKVNAEIERIRGTAKIWGAVYIVDTLGGEESIEQLAVRVFEKWKLGEAGVDNGLLLVLAMKDRKSRFEVGYGLEGTITDVAALHALDTHLAPKMRAGDTAGAIVDAFAYLSRLVEKDPAAVNELASLATAASAEDDYDFASSKGLHGWYTLALSMWIGMPLHKLLLLLQRGLLLRRHPELAEKAEEEQVANGEYGGFRKAHWKNVFILPLIVSINPGLFVLLLADVFEPLYYAALILPALIILIATIKEGLKYASADRYLSHLRDVAKQRQDMIQSGYVVKSDAGTYTYTPSYRASRRSSSSSSRSSSSGGGRSGGGGASSGW